jgi:hypothetical protein
MKQANFARQTSPSEDFLLFEDPEQQSFSNKYE